MLKSKLVVAGVMTDGVTGQLFSYYLTTQIQTAAADA